MYTAKDEFVKRVFLSVASEFFYVDNCMNRAGEVFKDKFSVNSCSGIQIFL